MRKLVFELLIRLAQIVRVKEDSQFAEAVRIHTVQYGIVVPWIDDFTFKLTAGWHHFCWIIGCRVVRPDIVGE